MKVIMKKMENFKGSPWLAAAAAIILVIMAVSLAVSCGEQTPSTSSSGTKSAGITKSATAATSPTSTANTTKPLSPTTNGYSVSRTGNSAGNTSGMWSSVFKVRKDPFIQQVSQKTSTTSATTSTTGTSTAPYTNTGSSSTRT